MSLNDLKKQVDSWINQQDIKYWEPLSILAAIAEENGELAREINDRFGGRIKKETDDTKDIGDELADIVFNIICLANSQGINLDEAWQRKMDKCHGRDKDRFKK